MSQEYYVKESNSYKKEILSEKWPTLFPYSSRTYTSSLREVE